MQKQSKLLPSFFVISSLLTIVYFVCKVILVYEDELSKTDLLVLMNNNQDLLRIHLVNLIFVILNNLFLCFNLLMIISALLCAIYWKKHLKVNQSSFKAQYKNKLNYMLVLGLLLVFSQGNYFYDFISFIKFDDTFPLFKKLIWLVTKQQFIFYWWVINIIIFTLSVICYLVILLFTGVYQTLLDPRLITKKVTLILKTIFFKLVNSLHYFKLQLSNKISSFIIFFVLIKHQFYQAITMIASLRKYYFLIIFKKGNTPGLIFSHF